MIWSSFNGFICRCYLRLTCTLPTPLVSKLIPPLGNVSILIKGTDSYPAVTVASSKILVVSRLRAFGGGGIGGYGEAESFSDGTLLSD